MKINSLLYRFLALFSMIGVASADANKTQNVVVTNSTSDTVNEFYASASDSAGWDTSNNIISSLDRRSDRGNKPR
jgi:hypothetical protein